MHACFQSVCAKEAVWKLSLHTHFTLNHIYIYILMRSYFLQQLTNVLLFLSLYITVTKQKRRKPSDAIY